MPRKGKVKYDPKWELTPEKKVALLRLAQLGVDVYSTSTRGIPDYTLLIPHDLPSPRYIEIGFLMAQLDETFPVEGQSLCDLAHEDSYLEREKRFTPVAFIDSYPHGLKYRVYPRKYHENESTNTQEK